MRKETIAVGGFLAGYCDSTRRSYATDVRLFSAWCHEANLTLLSVRRAHLELYGRWMEESGRMRSTVGRRLSTLASFYKHCEQEQVLDANPALNVCRPKWTTNHGPWARMPTTSTSSVGTARSRSSARAAST